ncbi:VOC family protein [Mucilaginibacter sp. SG564]|uniref:VOC family protein n=1 Tax=unclassified Mucilaginibacter TaxID=2617802 RepID=UPI0015529DE9|nr:VOC family protein [Mucilaginibacter sp. SG564]NOW95164.1 catechol 2,3-dioxygenase-like lactoylglutathione lyase family enzyme [Mucilaginibacter sp. SG564]
MALKSITPMLYTLRVKESVDFYVSNLGFTCVGFDEDWGWATVSRDDIEIMIALPNEHETFTVPKFTGSFYIRTNNVDELWNELKEKAVICYPIEDFNYGMREFAVFDNNAYILQFGTPLE